MARKKRKANKRYVQPAGREINAPVGVQKRKSSRYLTLAIMGGAAFFALRSCNSDDDKDRFYTTVQQCADDGNAHQLCEDAWKTAKQGLTAGVTSSLTYNQCMLQYGTYGCNYDSGSNSYVPFMAGFTLAKVNEKSCDPQHENCGTHTTHTSSFYSYHSGGQAWAARPVWRDRHGDYVYRSGETAERYVNTQPLNKSKTVSRGGWGSSSKSFSSRGS